jgi:hypothetical protein
MALNANPEGADLMVKTGPEKAKGALGALSGPAPHRGSIICASAVAVYWVPARHDAVHQKLR